MKRVLLMICNILIINASLFAQKYEPVMVRAGMMIEDCFSFNERYRYPAFVNGRIQLKSGVSSDKVLNYDFLSGEIEYIKGKDTLAIANGKDIRFIVVASDTFYYYKGAYLEQISGGAIKVVLKQYIKMKEILKKDSYGTSSSGSATNSYGSLPTGGNFYKLVANEDMLFQRTLEYYLSDPEGGFVPFSKKNVMHQFPEHESQLKAYIKSSKIDFDNREDLIRLSVYLRTL